MMKQKVYPLRQFVAELSAGLKDDAAAPEEARQ